MGMTGVLPAQDNFNQAQQYQAQASTQQTSEEERDVREENKPSPPSNVFCPAVRRVTREGRETRSLRIVNDEMDLQSVSCASCWGLHGRESLSTATLQCAPQLALGDSLLIVVPMLWHELGEGREAGGRGGISIDHDFCPTTDD